MKLLPLATALMLATTALAQQKNTPPPQAHIKQKQAEVNIPGTRVYMTPPPGAKPATTFKGFELDNATIQIYDLSVGNYYTNGATFSREGFEKKGVKVDDYKETIIDGYPAKYAQIEAKGGKAYSLIFGDSTFSVMAMASVPPGDAALAEQVKKSIFSIKYHKTEKPDPFASAPFEITGNTSRLKFVISSGNMYVFNYSGSTDEQDKDAAVAILTPMPGGSGTAKDDAKALMMGIQSKSEQEIKTRTESEEAINGYDAYESENTCAAEDGKTKLIHLTVLRQGKKCVSIVCMSANNADADLKEFKKFVRGVKLK